MEKTTKTRQANKLRSNAYVQDVLLAAAEGLFKTKEILSGIDISHELKFDMLASAKKGMTTKYNLIACELLAMKYSATGCALSEGTCQDDGMLIDICGSSDEENVRAAA